jgi:hypothetical protein
MPVSAHTAPDLTAGQLTMPTAWNLCSCACMCLHYHKQVGKKFPLLMMYPDAGLVPMVWSLSRLTPSTTSHKTGRSL